MVTDTITVTVLKASDGCKLTQSDTSISADKRIIASTVYLAVNDSADNWTEITDEEAATYQAEAEALAEDNAEE